MNRPLKLALFAIAVSSLVVSSVIAQPPGGGRGPGGRGPGGGGPEHGGPGGSPMEMLNRMFDDADANGDGLLSREEVTAAMNGERGRDQRGGMKRGPGGPPPRHGDNQYQSQRGPRDQKGPRDDRGHGAHGDHRGPGEQGPPPPPRPGQILHGHLADSLNLTSEQQEKLDALQAEVDERLAAVLTEEQKQMIAEHQQHGPRGEGPPPREGRDQDRRGGRPQRPQ